MEGNNIGRLRQTKSAPATSNHYVYILYCNDGKYYRGCTSDLKKRMERHHKGWVDATKDRRPIKLVWYCMFTDKYKAFEFEKYLKSGSGRTFTNKHLV